MKFSLSFFMLLCIPGLAFAQARYSPSNVPYETDPTIKSDVSVMVEPLDKNTLSYGIDYDEINDGAKKGAEAAGWAVSDASDYGISVKVVGIGEKEDSQQQFEVEVAGGSTSFKLGNGLGGLTMTKKVEISKENRIKLFSTVSQLVTQVSQRLRRDVIRRNFLMNRRVETPTSRGEQLH